MNKRDYHPDMELTGSGSTDYGHNLANKILKERDVEDSMNKHELKKVDTFLQGVERTGLTVNNHNRNNIIESLKKYNGYAKINRKGQDTQNGDKGRVLESAPNNQLYGILMNTYNSCLKRKKELQPDIS